MPDSGSLVSAQVDLASHLCVFDARKQACFKDDGGLHEKVC